MNVSTFSRTDSPARFARRVVLVAAALAAVAGLLSAWLSGGFFAVSVLYGALISVASFSVLAWVVVASFKGGARAAFYSGLGLLKIFLIGAVLWWILSHKLADPAGFMVGFSMTVLALIVEALRTQTLWNPSR